MSQTRAARFLVSSLLLSLLFCWALDASADIGFYEVVETTAPDPGPAPDTAHVRRLIAGTLISTAAGTIGFLMLPGRVRKLNRRKKWGTGIGVMGVGILITVLLTDYSESYADYREWKRPRRPYERGDKIKQEFFIPPNLVRYDRIPGHDAQR